MIIDKFKDKWFSSCGNWVDKELSWLLNCCEEKLKSFYNCIEHKGYGLSILN